MNAQTSPLKEGPPAGWEGRGGEERKGKKLIGQSLILRIFATGKFSYLHTSLLTQSISDLCKLRPCKDPFFSRFKSLLESSSVPPGPGFRPAKQFHLS